MNHIPGINSTFERIDVMTYRASEETVIRYKKHH